MTKQYTGKQFKCTCPDFEGEIGVILDAWYEHWGVLYLQVVGEDFRGVFTLAEGEII